jgi:hypothetical protein
MYCIILSRECCLKKKSPEACASALGGGPHPIFEIMLLPPHSFMCNVEVKVKREMWQHVRT